MVECFSKYVIMTLNKKIIKISILLLVIIGLCQTYLHLYYSKNTINEDYLRTKNKLECVEEELVEKNNQLIVLRDSLSENQEELSWMYGEVKRLSDENSVFSSILSEIYVHPDGTKILDDLWVDLTYSKSND